jgi:hypothetical protein
VDSLSWCGVDGLSRCGVDSLSRRGVDSLSWRGMNSLRCGLSMCGLLVFGSFRSWCFVRRLCVDIHSTCVNHVLLGFFLVRFGSNLFVLIFCLGLLVDRFDFNFLVNHCDDRFRDRLWLGLFVMNLRHNDWFCGLGFFMFDLGFGSLRLLVGWFFVLGFCFGLFVYGDWFFLGCSVNGLFVFDLGYWRLVDRLGFDLFMSGLLMFNLSDRLLV